MRKEMFNHEITILRDTYRRLLRRNAKVNLIKLTGKTHPADLAEVFRHFSTEEQIEIFSLMKENEHAAEFLVELDDALVIELLENESYDRIASIIKKAPTNDTFMAKMKSIYNNFNLNDPAILEMIEAGTYKEPFRPINYGSVPGGKNAVQPGIVIDLRNIKGFDRKLLAKIGFQEYKEGGKTDINKYSALAEIDILGVAV